ncbi:uncharacterized protein EDB91DRAFT_1183339 [Suillus paluster]|uniref:uncharacterized protein n=1 Tax=Suillus paluster TaxID=48578 RepID=UPI001B8670FE|nr:uncharacterized protein EDB91DRAFT_1183339 [Suillus paluster]KAG1718847.1 hypothetical protein EDB91DRAFT_1183339 [Suillus paluster]
MENDTPQAEFAFLSACHTATGLQFSGFKSVIGTLWVVDDENMFKGFEGWCLGLLRRQPKHSTMLRCGVKKLVPLEQRIVFIHIGV